MKYSLIKVIAAFSFLIILIFLFLYIKNNHIKDPKKNNQDPKKNSQSHKKSNESSFNDTTNNLINFEKEVKIETTKILDNGIVIKWFSDNGGRKIKFGEVVLIEYRLALPDGKIIDGNNKLDLPFLPFVLGYNMQTPGWDFAIKELSVGDFVKIEIPSALAYGEKGIKNIIPSNTVNWLYVKVHSFVKPSINKDGITYWKLEEGDQKISENAKRELTFHTIASTSSRPSVINTYLNDFPTKHITGTDNVVPGLRQLLKNANKGDKYYVILESNQAYGSIGYSNLINANESVFFIINVIDSRLIKS